ncbi:hypothetical protein DSO57_1034803 [Entomophthora muscae]|uniref:Uncharacterized protein n=1 Tax=Entomophthora muscae TaxID=34485 RepID=A0ACC2TMI9_9FUNG|nr:hypothetical protein DSO57_1034803 [Entomophthora muscae]
MKLFQLIPSVVLAAAPPANNGQSANRAANPDFRDEPFSKDMCSNEKLAHEYMAKWIKPYGECFKHHFFTYPTKKVCDTKCLDSVIRASQIVQYQCKSGDLTEDEYEGGYKKKSYKPWSSYIGAQAMCTFKDISNSCMSEIQNAETHLSPGKKCKRDMKGEKESICSPCVEKIYTLYHNAPANSPFNNAHQVSNVKQIFENINCTCSFTPKGPTAKESEKDDMLNPGLDFSLIDIR